MIENAVRVLNELLVADPGATNEFFRLNTMVNTRVCDHPTIQVLSGNQGEKPVYGILRPLGLINGLFQEDNKVVVMIEDESTSRITGFVVGTLENGKVKIC